MLKRLLALLLAVLIISTAAVAENYTVYVLCQPDSFVYVRQFPKRDAQEAGYAELGDELTTDGTKRNGFLWVGGFEGGGWIYSGFVTRCPVTVARIETEVESRGRVACRRYINGTRRKWLKNGQKVVVFAFADDWTITNQGFIQTQYLGVLSGE